MRQTVEAVERLSPGGSPITEQQLVKDLGLAKSTISYRVSRALRGGYLVNQNTKGGAAAQLVLGAPLPDGSPLPHPEELVVCVETHESESNSRTPTTETAMEQIGTESSRGVRTEFESDSNGAQGYPGREFERFEGFPRVTTHAGTADDAAQEKLPWDDFLREVDGNAPHPG